MCVHIYTPVMFDDKSEIIHEIDSKSALTFLSPCTYIFVPFLPLHLFLESPNTFYQIQFHMCLASFWNHGSLLLFLPVMSIIISESCFSNLTNNVCVSKCVKESCEMKNILAFKFVLVFIFVAIIY